MGGAKKSWYEREEVKKVTLDWVKTNCKITNREFELLEIIKDRKLVRRDMLEVISPSYRYIGKSRTRVMNRSINKLFSNMCIDKVHEKQAMGEGNSPAIISLDRAGSLMLDIPYKQRIKKNRKTIKGKEFIFRSLPLNYRHVNGVNKLEVETILLLEESGGEIVTWDLENPINIYHNGDKLDLIPDVLTQIRFHKKQKNPFYAYIEFDTGSENIRYKSPPIIRDKVIKYKKYKTSKLWEDKFEYFPLLMLVTEDDSRVDFFNRKCKESNIDGLGVYYKNYTQVLNKMTTMV